jgi:TolA-binding protein
MALAHYWKGESYFKLEKYSLAINHYEIFLTTPGAYSSDFYNLTNYNLAYCHFKQKNYQAASVWFRKYVDNAPAGQSKINYDAWVRLGDSYFVQRRYEQALTAYKAGAQVPTEKNDYAIFQQGFSAGILHRYEEKIDILTPLTTRENSLLADDALFESGLAYIQLNKIEQSIQQFEQLIEKFPTSNYYKKSHLQAGLMYFNLGNNPKAEHHFKHLVENHKGTDEYAEALVALKNVYLDQNQVDQYFQYAKSHSINISANEQDSLLYLSAEKAYLNNDTTHSRSLFEEYLERFNDGQFVLKSHFYLAQILYNEQNFQQAIPHYEYIVAQPQNSFTQTALYNIATIYENNKNYGKAWEYYHELEAIANTNRLLLESRIGQMRAAIEMNEHEKIDNAASKILITDKVPTEITNEARFAKAQALEKLENPKDALTQYRLLAQNLQNKYGARAQYEVARIVYEQGKTVLAESEIQRFIKNGTPHQYWLGKSFLLLSKIYEETGKAFQAKAFLQSILGNYAIEDDGIITEAKKRLSELSIDDDQKFSKDTSNIELELQKNNGADTTRIILN